MVRIVTEVSFLEALKFWFKLGWINFGGPAGQIALMHREIVEKRKWVSEKDFLHALNFCMILPGPEAQQLSIYIGWLLHGVRGGLVAGTFFILPSLFILLTLCWIYVTYGHVEFVVNFFWGLKAVVLGLIFQAVPRIGRKTLRTPVLVVMALASLLASFYSVSFPLIFLIAALMGILMHRYQPSSLSTAEAHTPIPTPTHVHFRPRRAIGHFFSWALLGAAMWLAPYLCLLFFLSDKIFSDIALFFSKAALITFGGAYAVLPYMAKASVESYQWLSYAQMMDGLGLAETTPGPLIMVVTFVGFVASYIKADTFSPLQSALAGGLIATYFTFLPSYFFIFMGAPWVQYLQSVKFLTAAMKCITACVVGMIFHLACLMVVPILMPDSGLDRAAVALALFSFVMLQWRKWEVWQVVLVGVAAGGLKLFLN